MASRSVRSSAQLFDYIAAVSLREPEPLRRLRAETERQPLAQMRIDPEQGQFMALLARILGARRCLEIGTFTGYSALWVALALPPDGQLITCDINEETTAVARRHWQAAGVAERIDLRLGPALGTLDALIGAGRSGTFDFAFIDADKESYDAYYERVLGLLRPGGLVLVDNVLWGGSVADPKIRDRTTTALRAFNRKLHEDARIDLCLLAMGDGLTVARKR